MVSPEKFKEVEELVLWLKGKENWNHNADTIRKIFNLHNEVTGIMEYSTSCGSCRARVWGRLKDWYEENKELYGSQS